MEDTSYNLQQNSGFRFDIQAGGLCAQDLASLGPNASPGSAFAMMI
jgi:hypothetical protein